MTEKKPRNAKPVVAAAALLLALLIGSYVAGYFCLTLPPPTSVTFVEKDDPTHYRNYPLELLATIYAPMARFESWLIGQEVRTRHVTVNFDSIAD
jgi:hypothetical protein